MEPVLIRSWWRTGAGLLVLWLPLSGGLCPAREGRGGGQAEERRIADAAWENGALTASFFGQTTEGQALLSFLLCTDLDCVEALREVERHGSSLVPVLLEVLDSGLPAGLAPEGSRKLIRRRTVIALGRLGDARAVAPVVELLEDPDPLLRSAAVEALGWIGEEVDLSDLLPRLRDPDPLVRETTAAALGKLEGASEALPALREAAAAEELDHVRRTIEAAIAKIERR